MGSERISSGGYETPGGEQRCCHDVDAGAGTSASRSRTSSAATVPWDTIRRLRTHLEAEQRYAFVDALDKLGEKACEAEEYAAAFDAMENGIETPKPKVVARGTVKLERVDDA